MCGRFVSATPPDELAEYFGVDEVVATTPGPSFNVAPTNEVFVVFEDGGTRRLDTFRWGLVPSWAKDLSIGSKMINARAETVAEKPSYKRALAKRRCIIPADGFFEWKPVAKGETGGLNKKGPKQPFYIHRPEDEPYAFAGLWEVWRGGPKPSKSDAAEQDGPAEGEQEIVHTCTILTGAPNSAMAQLHDRMPIILPPDRWDPWLDRDLTDTVELVQFLVPAAPELITFHPVSTAVNSVRNKGPENIEPVESPDQPSQQSLL
jgi:putative SOS response-associated peptidase YedK